MLFDGLRVLALESRRAVEIAELIRRNNGSPFVAPSMREAPLSDRQDTLLFAKRLFDGEFEMSILLTGVGTRALDKIVSAHYGSGRFAEALRKTSVVARGPKPAAVLRDLQVPIAVLVPEPNTWRELLNAIEDRPERKIAIQEYGKSNPELLEGLRARGASVATVRSYAWELPEDTGPLREAAHRLARGEVDVTLFTTSIQIVHLLRIAREEGLEAAVLEGLSKTVIASIGPSTTEALEEFGLRPHLEPSHPKMGFLVLEAAQKSAAILGRKRGK